MAEAMRSHSEPRPPLVLPALPRALAWTLAVCAVLAGSAVGATIGSSIGGVSWRWGAVQGALGAAGAVAFTAMVLVVMRWSGLLDREGMSRLCDPQFPLLRRLKREAPGTYVHSAAVASLAETAAEAVGADPVVCRVAGYYHDVGKLIRPAYFFENQAGLGNPHDDAPPARSAAMITQHVDEGVKLARHYGLPRSVVDIIQQHHGSGLVRYFYVKAVQSDAVVVESDYRYRSPKPQSVEAAIVMLADSSEAAVRALVKADADSIQEVVTAVFDERLADGQLDESGLTDQSRGRICEAFVRVLIDQRHDRCPYPSARN